MRARRRVGGRAGISLTAVAVLACSAPAVAATVQRPPLTVVSPAAVDADCTAGLRVGPGVTHRRITAPADGALRVTLEGRGDWDLALFDARTRRPVASSAGLGGSEVVTATVRRDGVLLAQACRRDGAAGSARARLTTSLTPADLSRLRRRPRLSLVDVPLRDPGARARLSRTGADIAHGAGAGADSARVVVGDGPGLARLRAAGFAPRTLVPDLAARAAGARVAADGSGLPTGRTTYRTYDDYQRELRALATAHPEVARLRALPTRSYQGREIQVLELASDVGARDDGRPSILIAGLHHAREWPTGEVVMELAWDLVSRHGHDARITRLLDGVRVLLLPIANPDGFVVSRGAGAVGGGGPSLLGDRGEVLGAAVVPGGQLAFKRKNCNPVGTSPGDVPCAFAAGVDLNRNYATGWGGAGSSDEPRAETYRGAAPFSEPETRAVRDLVATEGPTVVLALHNFGALVLRPPGVDDGPAPDEEALRELGDAMADAAGHRSRRGWELYPTTGTTDEWAYEATGAFGYTIELGPSDGAFHGDYRRHVVDEYLGRGATAGRGVREALLLAAEAARDRDVVGRLTVAAPPGRTLRLTQRTSTATASGRRVDERLSLRTVVPRDGRADWRVTPSTRPQAAEEGRHEAYVLECLDGTRVRGRTEVVVARGEHAVVPLRCGGRRPELRTAGGTALGAVRTSAARANADRRAVVRVGTARTLRDVRVRLRSAGGRVLAEGRRSRLPRSRRVGLRLRDGVRLVAGRRYRLELRAERPGGATVRLARTVRAR